ncbi:ABC transporter substrate-binding protein [Bacillus sp. UNC438CL73TsuS30]|uniref:ABC transporter substrate-binding protein n=1 Tax=Bacillus sp. UNC438CL73TsuS30 TaxID=1340434 RepID=UPI0006910776|nr:sugar ABC transporter substrate-binding protein [Bacillus sp. UNC438CL73TsuS30]
MKMKFLLVLLIGCLLFAAGCGRNSESSSGKVAGKVNLEWFMWAGNDAEVKNWQAMADEVNKKYPDIHVELKTAPWTEYWSKLQTQIAGGTAPDIISMQSMRLKSFGSALVPLNKYIEKDFSFKLNEFNSTIIKNMKYDGKQAVIPYDFGAMIIYYNKDLFKKYNVPEPKPGWTWNDFQETAKALSKDGNYGFITNGYPDYWFPLVLSNGGSYLKDGKYSINSPKNVQTMQNLADMVKEKVSPQMVATNNGSWANEQWLKGNIGMVVDGPWDTLWYKGSAKFDFGVATIPVGNKDSVSVSAGSGFAISKGSEHPEEAYKAITALTSLEAQKELASAGRAYPAREGALQAYFKQVPKDFKPVLEYADQHTVPYEITDTWNQASDMITKAMIPILNGEQSPKDGLDKLQKQLESIQK